MAKQTSIAAIALGFALTFFHGGGEIRGEDLTNWIKPQGFYSPKLAAGQYSFQSGLNLWGYTSRTKRYEEEANSIQHGKSTTDLWNLRSSIIYGLTDSWVINASITFAPGQKYRDQFSDQRNGFQTNDWRTNELEYNFVTNLGFSFRPTRLVELFARGSYEKSFEDTRSWHQYTSDSFGTSIASYYGDDKMEFYDLFIGFNIAR